MSLDSSRDEIETLDETVKHSSAEIQRRTFLIGALKLELEMFDARIDDSERSLEEAKTQNERLKDRQSRYESELKNLNRDQLLEIENRNVLEREFESLENKKRSLEERVRENYNTDLTEVSREIDALRKSLPQMTQAEIAALREEMRKLGPVYPSAIEEYQKLEERYTELKKQYDDLIVAEENILDTIESLNESMTRQFSERFGVLNQKFNEIFSALFEGGEARMEYVDPEDVLESGIELSAQPPGKSLKSLNLLSGGEKAMTAIALLLSFIALNPAPFSILDEIDAALDEQNIHRFTKLLGQMSKENQFIIITHRNPTLEVCDQINGITMSKDGVSRLCKLKISDYLND